jgi:hypothetical protein
MIAWRWIRNGLGVAGVALVLVLTLVTAVLAALIAPRLLSASEQAETRVSITQVTGGGASYELATFVADFQASLTSDPVRRVTAQAAGVTVASVSANLRTERLGDSSSVLVSFVAGSGEAADAGLRAAVRQGLAGLVNEARRRSDLELRAAIAQQSSVLSAVVRPQPSIDQGVPKEFRQRSRDYMIQRAAEGVADASGQAVLVQTAAKSLDGIIRTQQVSLQQLPTTSASIRIVLAAAGTCFLVAAAGVLVVRRRWPQSVPSALRLPDGGTVGGRHAASSSAPGESEHEGPPG